MIRANFAFFLSVEKIARVLVTLVVLFLSATLVCPAKPVDIDKASLAAHHYFKAKEGSLNLLYAPDNNAFYVFSNRSGRGFVIISGEDRIAPILAYSNNGGFRTDNMPDNLAYWMQGFQDEFLKSTTLSESVVSKANREWSRLLADQPENDRLYAEDGVLLETALWDQSDPYNRKAPVINGRRCVTGCVATAMAIVLRYHCLPVKGTGTLPDYTISTNFNQTTVQGYELGYEYDWDNMLLKYSSGFSDTQANAVATLMRDCGQMVFMEYGPSESGAYGNNILPALRQYMQYAGGMYVARSRYDSSKWDSLLKEELDSNHPIIYTAQSSRGGHAFVVDGYDSRGMFHINWGWSGSSNGYFRCPDFSEFTSSHHAVLGLDPPSRQEEAKIYLSFDENTSGMRSSTEEYIANESFSVDYVLENPTETEAEANLVVARQDKSGRINGIVSESQRVIVAPHGKTHATAHCVLSDNPNVGERIIMCTQDSQTSTLKRIYSKNDSAICEEILIGDEFTIEEATSLEYKAESAELTIRSKSGVWYSLFDSKDNPIMSGNLSGCTTILLDRQQYPSGTYRLQLTKGGEHKTIKLLL